MTDSYHSIIEPIIFTASRLEAIADKCLFRPIGINLSSVKIMGLLSHRQLMTPTEILELAGGTKSNISQRLTFLEKKGYIKTQKNTSGDKRKISVELTLTGKSKLREMQKHIRKVKLELESKFTKKEIANHYAFFNKLNKLIGSGKNHCPVCKIIQK